MINNFLERLALFKKQRKTSVLAVYVALDKVWVHKAANQSDSPVEIEFENAGDWEDVFAEIAKEFGPSNLRIVLAPHWYQLLSVDRPTGDDDEVANNLLWTVKDMVSLPVQNIHLDFFDSAIPNQPKLSVIVADKVAFQKLVLGALESELTIEGITIEELAMCHAIGNDSQARLIISHYAGQDMLFTVVRDGQLCMHRRIRGFSSIDSIPAEEFSLGVADNLSLELQRSMDYFESQLRQPPISAVDMLIDGDCEQLAKEVSENFNQPISALPRTAVGMFMAALAYQEWEQA